MFKKKVSLSVVNNRIIMFWKNVSLLVVKITKWQNFICTLIPDNRKCIRSICILVIASKKSVDVKKLWQINHWFLVSIILDLGMKST